MALFSELTALISWGMSPILSGLFVRQLTQRIKGLDYRAAGAAAYVGGATVWALGLSSSAAMLMATRSAIPPKLFGISGLIPLTKTIFLWPSLLMAAVLIVTGVSVAYFSAPPAEKARTAESYGLEWEPFQLELEPRTKPGEWLEYSPLLTILVGALLSVYLVDLFRTSPQGALAALDLNTFNLIFITAGLLLQWRPKRFLRAVMECVPGTAGVIIQFPLYAVIFGMIVGTGLSDKAARLLTSISTHDTFALLVALYSATLGVFIPSGGSKWIIEAPYVLQAAIQHRVNLGWVVQIYNASESLPNLINPFFMLPLLGNFAPARAGSGGIRIVAIGGASSHRVFPVLAVRAAFGLHPAHKMSYASQDQAFESVRRRKLSAPSASRKARSKSPSRSSDRCRTICSTPLKASHETAARWTFT